MFLLDSSHCPSAPFKSHTMATGGRKGCQHLIPEGTNDLPGYTPVSSNMASWEFLYK